MKQGGRSQAPNKLTGDSKGLQVIFITIRYLPDLTRHLPVAYSVIEEIVEGF
jgi:hypothetical protein